jgi:5-methylcytosine-specific restriction endonuclease McrA
MSENYRRSLLEPIPELDLAAELLDSAVDALIIGDKIMAASLMKEADHPAIMEYATRMLGKLNYEVHRQVSRPKNIIPKSKRTQVRMPSQSVQRCIFLEDGWRCRFCGTKTICREARKILVREFPEIAKWGNKEFERHSALYAMAVSLDHIVPHSRGGENERSNFVTACYCCQFGRGEWTLEESELFDPRKYPAKKSSWDGLSRLTFAKGV